MESLQRASRELRKEFEALIVEHRPDLWRYCLYLTRSPWDAEDLTQDTIVKAFAHMSHLYQVVNVKAYLFRMASNLWIDWCRRARLMVDHDEFLSQTVATTVETDSLDVMDSIEDLVRLLPPRQRVILLLVDVFEFSVRETAEMLLVTEGAVKAALHRARATLKANASTGPVGQIVEKAPSPVVKAYLKAFNDRDPDAIAALLDDQAVTDLVGVTQEYGKETIRRNSLSDWAMDPIPMHAKYVDLDGTSFVTVLCLTEEGQEQLGAVIRLTESGERITQEKYYYFCPEFLQYMAVRLHIAAQPNGYFWGS